MPTMTDPIGRTDAWLALLGRLGLPDDVARDPKWSAAPDFLGLIVDHALAARPATIVECSSGTTTVLLARCCALTGTGRVYSLENGPEFARRTRRELTRLGLDGHASVLDAPLRPCRVDGREFRWYDLGHLPGRPIDMLVIDGPPGFIQRHSRYPALPRLRDRLAPRCALFLDDAARPEEREIVADWRAALPGAAFRFVDNERGCAILHLDGPPP
jgi:predicted O-methyltransferase YrrM